MEDFVSFDLAKKLKEKGFREECIAYYHTDGELLYNIDQYRGGDYKSLLRSYNSLPKNPIGAEQIDAPTISQVSKWLREEYKLYLCPCVIADYEDDYHPNITYWSFIIVNIETGDSIYREYEKINEARYNSHDQAALAGIEYVIDNLI